MDHGIDRVADQAARCICDHVGNVRASRGIQKGLEQLDGERERHGHQQAAQQAAPLCGKTAAEREEKAKRDRHDHIQDDLTDKIAAPEQGVLKGRHVHGNVRMVEAEGQRGKDRHERHKQDAGEIEIHRRVGG